MALVLPPLAEGMLANAASVDTIRHDRSSLKDPALRRAQRLAAVADSVGSIDVEALAATYQKEAGMSGIEATAAAAAAMNAALKSALGGGSSTEAAQRQVRDVARRRAREARSEAWKAAQAEEEGELGEVRRDEVRHAMEARNSRAVEHKTERLADEMAARRAVREERLLAAAGRRELAEARARFGIRKQPRLTAPAFEADATSAFGSDSQAAACSDPALRRAKALCDGAARVIQQLEAQNQMLKGGFGSKSLATLPTPGSVSASGNSIATLSKAGDASRARADQDDKDYASRFQSAHAAAVDADEAQLLARAKELLADYKPSGNRPAQSRKQSVVASHSGSPKQESKRRQEASVVMSVQRGRPRPYPL
mmetsp:Transcript_65274/g.155975  ORF Transcript_65274/g.155975 Transcript_65274/m.155975 type:complete len:369 (+) Transcript_65274:69-1175(+)